MVEIGPLAWIPSVLPSMRITHRWLVNYRAGEHCAHEASSCICITRYTHSHDAARAGMYDFEVCVCQHTILQVGGEPFKGLPREANMPAWSGMMAGFLSTRHVVVPSSIEVDEAAGTASLAASVTASHVLPPAEAGGADRLWTTTGAYAMKWERGADDAVWRIRALTYKQTSSEPADPSAFIEEAKSRATAAAAPAAAEAAPAASA